VQIFDIIYLFGELCARDPLINSRVLGILSIRWSIDFYHLTLKFTYENK
jgi:hypothetical protein